MTLPQGVDVSLYRIAQEALTNIIRHAHASEVTLELTQRNDGVRLRIHDNGRGFAPHQSSHQNGKRHLGLISMSERAEMVGGTLHVGSEPGQGTTIDIFVPIQESIRS